MQIFDFENHFRRVERAKPEELNSLREELHTYLNGPIEEQAERQAAFNAFLRRQTEQGEVALQTIRDLLAQAVEA